MLRLQLTAVAQQTHSLDWHAPVLYPALSWHVLESQDTRIPELGNEAHQENEGVVSNENFQLRKQSVIVTPVRIRKTLL